MFRALFAKNGLSMDRLHALVLLRDKGSLIRAADGDPVRQSQLSRHLKDLASYFELELVEKAGKSLKLTPAGEELADLGAGHFRELSAFRERALKMPHTVVIGAEGKLLASTIAPAMGRIGRTPKECRYELKDMDGDAILEALHDQKISLGFLSKPTIPKSLQTAVLFEQKYGIIIPDRLVSTRGMLTPPLALFDCPHAFNSSDEILVKEMAAIAEKMGGEFQPHLVCSAEEQCIAAVRSGFFASVLPLSALEALGGIAVQVVEPPEFGSLTGQIVAAWNKRHLLVNPYVAPIRDSLKELLKE